MSDGQCVVIPPNVNLLAGPQVIGHLFNYGLFGVLSAQVYIYTLAFPDDPKRLKSIVYGLYTVEVAQVILAARDAVAVLGAGWGNPKALNSPQLLWIDIPIMSGIVSACVQSFFAWRITLLSKSWLLGAFICTISVMQAVGAIITGVIAFTTNDDSELQYKTFKSCTVWLGGSAACDMLIASCMVYFCQKSHTSYNTTTDRLLSRLVRLTVQTGMLTASVAIVDLVLFLSFRNNNLHFAPALVLAKMYTNSIMTVFNNRVHISKNCGSSLDESECSSKSLSNTLGWSVAAGPRIRRRAATTTITEEMTTDHDGDEGYQMERLVGLTFLSLKYINKIAWPGLSN
ncbi:hypothetical protein K439DRAFT_1406554 [Ramaria rubella]|nr:hypothetical protein K439DRAFT_1406554 [Ramaria rubella]